MNLEENPSVAQANRVLRVLNAERKKYTVQIHKLDGSVIEYQSEDAPKLDWNAEARALWINEGGYNSSPVMPYETGMIIQTELNPKAKEP